MNNSRGWPCSTGSPYVLLVLTILCMVGIAPAAEAGPSSQGEAELRLEQRLFSLVNRTRSERNLRQLKTHRALSVISKGRASAMARQGKLSHQLPGQPTLQDRLVSEGLYFVTFGENLAHADLAAAPLIRDGFLESPSHRSNILSESFTHAAVGVVFTESGAYISQVFLHMLAAESSEAAEFKLKESLEHWYVQTLNRRFFYHHPSERWVRIQARAGMTSPLSRSLPFDDQPARLYHLVHPSWEIISEQLKSHMLPIDVQSLSVGVTIGRTGRFPGGAFSVVALIFGTPYTQAEPDVLNRMLLARINHILSESNRSILRLNTELSEKARTRLRRSPPAGRVRLKRRNTEAAITFTTVNPSLIPGAAIKMIERSGHITGMVGIATDVDRQRKKKEIRVCLILETTR